MREATNYMRAPKEIARTSGKSAHWYANKKSIDVYIAANGVVLTARIPRADLVRYIKETGDA